MNANYYDAILREKERAECKIREKLKLIHVGYVIAGKCALIGEEYKDQQFTVADVKWWWNDDNPVFVSTTGKEYVFDKRDGDIRIIWDDNNED